MGHPGARKKTFSSPSIIVADDDREFLKVLEHHLHGWSFQVHCVLDKGELFRRLAECRPQLMLLDVQFGQHDGLEILRQVLGEYGDLKVVMQTAYGSIDSAISAMKLGAVDYLTKPIDLKRLHAVLDHIDDDRPRRTDGAGGAVPEATPLSRPILGESRAVRDLRALIERIAPTSCTVLVLGESGTGKELIARAIHERTQRRTGPFIPLNVAALPRELVESTLFGHAKGAFTGAEQMESGCCEAANGGTLFLDEIGEMELGLQAKLLRFLQERSFQRVGQSQTITVDVRIIAATNRDPLEQVRRGQLREDLYYRLNVVPIVAPPLRERSEDIPLLAQHFMERWASRSGRVNLRLSDSALLELREHTWPGNVRELENLIERLAVLAPGPMIEAAEIRGILNRSSAPGNKPPIEPPTGRETATGLAGPHARPTRAIDRIEYDAIADALATSNGNVREAARRLGLGQATVYRKIKKYKML